MPGPRVMTYAPETRLPQPFALSSKQKERVLSRFFSSSPPSWFRVGVVTLSLPR